MKKSYRILQLQFYKGTHTPSTNYIQRILHPESNSTCRRQRALRVLLLLHTEGKETFNPERNSTHRRQGDLLEIHQCVLQDLPKTFQAFQTFITFQPIQAILQVPVSPGNPPHSSILQLECIFYKQFQFDWFPQKLHRVPVGQYKLQTLHSSKKGRCCNISQFDILQNRVTGQSDIRIISFNRLVK